MEPDALLCSRRARPQKALGVRAQWKLNQPPSLENASKLGGSILRVTTTSECTQLTSCL